MPDRIGLVILAAGKGKRMLSSTPKPLFNIMGQKLIDYPIAACDTLLGRSDFKGHIGVVLGYEAKKIQSYIERKACSLSSSIFFAFQNEQKGTADALKSYMDNGPIQEIDTVIVMYADTPLVGANDLWELYRIFKQNKRDALLASFVTDHPKGYGRIVRHTSLGLKIIEEKEANDEEKKIQEANSGIYVFKKEYILQHLKAINNNNCSGEYYLTDLFGFNKNVEAVLFPDRNIFRGINTLEQLHDMERYLRLEKLHGLMNKGVRIIDKYSTFIDEDVSIESDAIIYPHVTIVGQSSIGPSVIIESGSVIKESVIGEKTIVKAGSYMDHTIVGRHVVLGPYAHLRPETIIQDKCRVGNFVEVKKSLLKTGVKVSHLSYIGDAEIGEETNIGCGFITCNYSGTRKYKTTIGRKTFIGSDSQMIAPVTIGDHCYVASGSTIDKDMDSGDFAIARSRQITKSGMAKKFLKNEEN